MQRNTIRLIVILGTISVIGIIIIQIYWVKQSLDIKEKELNMSINIALKNVAGVLAQYNESTLPAENPVDQRSSNYFVVNVNNIIDVNILDHYLRQEFIEKKIDLDFEYAVYDCSTDKMIYGDYVSFSDDKVDQKSNLPTCNKYMYYFGVYFPSKSKHLASNIGAWYFFSAILLIVIIFFTYAMFIILKQRRLSEIQKDFVNNMTHEFKTPISSISISADVLMRPDIINKPEKLANYAAIIKEQIIRLHNQVEKVLQSANIEKDNNLKITILDLHELIQQTIQNMDPTIRQKHGKIIFIPCMEKAFINADLLHLTNVLYNLLDNAMKYVETKPKIQISTQLDKSHIRLIIKDNGIGIGKEYQKKIFEKFFRVPTGNVHNVKGFGLGLNYVKNIVKSHKWKISVQSVKKEGSTFTLYIPLISENQEMNKQSQIEL